MTRLQSARVKMYTIYVRMEAQASIFFKRVLTRPLFEPSLCSLCTTVQYKYVGSVCQQKNFVHEKKVHAVKGYHAYELLVAL